MSPEQAGTLAALARLRGEIAADREAMARRTADLADAQRRLNREPGDTAALALAAWAVHGWYTALESLLERVARQIDADVPAGERWHRALLAQATVEVPGVRPAVLPSELRPELEELLAARHFLRHAYGAELDARKLAEHGARIAKVSERVERALDALDAFLRHSGEAAHKTGET
jgi:hypothetical protein